MSGSLATRRVLLYRLNKRNASKRSCILQTQSIFTIAPDSSSAGKPTWPSRRDLLIVDYENIEVVLGR